MTNFTRIERNTTDYPGWNSETMATPRTKRSKRYVAIAAFLIVIAIIGTTFALYKGGNALMSKDSGVSACEQMAANVKAGKKSSSSTKMTEVQRNEKLLPFQNSQYPDIKVAGTNLVETIYKADHMETDDTLASSIYLLTTIQTQYAALQTACAEHDVALPPLSAS